MAGNPDIQEGLAAVADFISKSDREIVDEIDTVTDTGESLDGYVFTHGDKNLTVYSTSGSHYFTLQYEYEVTGDVAVTEKIQRKLESVPDNQTGELEIDVELNQEDQEAARQKVAAINGSRDDGSIEKVQSKLTEMLTGTDYSFELHNQLNGPHGFILRKKLFVYEPDTRASDFDAACQTLISASMVPQNFLKTVYDIKVEMPNSGAESSDKAQTPGSRGFQ